MVLLKSSQLWRIIWNGRKIILIVSIISLALGLVFENFRTPSWKSTIPLVVSPSGERETADFNYDHYYSYEASDTLTDSLEEWLKTPSTRESAKSESKTPFRSSSWKIWENNNWSVKKKAPQLIEVSFYSKSSKEAEATEKSLKDKVDNFLTSFNQTGKPFFGLTNSTSSVEFQAPQWSIIGLLSLLWGILIGILLVLERENLKQREKLQ